MSDSLFFQFPELDTAYLDDAYGEDADMAATIFEQFLKDLPGNLAVLKEKFNAGDADGLRHHMHKQKPGFSYVGLTDVTEKLGFLEAQCQTSADIITHKGQIEQVIARIEATRPLIEKAYQKLQQL